MQEFLVRVLHVILVFLSELLRHALYRKTHLTLLFQHLYVNYNELDAYHDLVFVSCKVSTSQYFPYFTLSAAQPQRCRAVNTLHFNPFVRSTSAVSFVRTWDTSICLAVFVAKTFQTTVVFILLCRINRLIAGTAAEKCGIHESAAKVLAGFLRHVGWNPNHHCPGTAVGEDRYALACAHTTVNVFHLSTCSSDPPAIYKALWIVALNMPDCLFLQPSQKREFRDV